MSDKLKERLKLIGLRLWLVPYLFICFFITMVLGTVLAIGTIFLGLPSWIITGRASAWIDWLPEKWIDWLPENFNLPTIIEWNDFREDIQHMQQSFDKKYKKR